MEIVFTVPSLDIFTENNEDNVIPGEIKTEDRMVILNAGREAVSLKVVNNGDRPVQVFSGTCCTPSTLSFSIGFYAFLKKKCIYSRLKMLETCSSYT